MVSVQKTHSLEELETVFRIREKVFVEEQNVSPDEEYDEFEDTSEHYLAYFNGTPAGTARWRQTENGIKLERFAVLSEFRNQAVGSNILKRVLHDVKAEHPGKMVYLHAQLQAIPFYERQNFQKTGPQFTECNIEHFKMVLKS